MENSVTIIYIRNPFEPVSSREIEHADISGMSVGDAVSRYAPEADPGLTFTAAINGQLIGDRWDTVLVPGDSLSFCATPGRSSSGKNVFAVVAMVAVMVAAGPAGGFLATSMGFAKAGFTAKLMTAGIMAGGGYLINRAFPPKLPSYDGVGDSFEQSQTYGWSPGENAFEPGRALPVLYGKHRVVPPMIARYVETIGDKQYLNMLFAVAGHPVDDIYDIEVNDQPVDNYDDDVQVDTRPGDIEQTPVEAFEDQRTDTAIQAQFATEWTVRQISGAVDSFAVGLLAPSGLYYANDAGGLDEVSIPIEMQYRKIGDAQWREWVGHQDYGANHDISERLSDTKFRVDGTDIVNVERRFPGRPSYETMLPDDAMIKSYPGGTEHPVANVVASQSSTQVYQEGYDHQGHRNYKTVYSYHTEITVSSETPLPPDMESFEYAAPYNVSGAQTSAQRWFFSVDEPYDGHGEYEYRFRFFTDPPSGSRYGSELQLEYHQAVIDDAFEHPYTALLSIRALATDQLSGGQARVSCMVDRMTVYIPTSDDPESTPLEKPATNPAWVSYHMLIDELNGGGVSTDRVTFDAFDAWADQCTANDLSCNIYFDDMVSLKRAMDTIGMLGRGQVVQMGSRFTTMTDFEEPAVQRFSFGMGNIEAESFEEEWLPMADRADEIEVTFWDENKNFDRRQVSVQQDGYEVLGRSPNKQSIPLYGCTDRQMAIKYAKFLLNQNKLLTLTASWGADVDAIACLPNDVVDVSHDVPKWGQSGRIADVVDSSTLILDRGVDLEYGKTYIIDVRLSDDSRQTRTFNAGSTETVSTVSFDTPFDPLPDKYDNYHFGELAKQHKPFRIVSITRDGDLRRKITALEYVPEVYADDAVVPDSEDDPVVGIYNLAAKESWASSSDGSGRSVIHVSWRNRYAGRLAGGGGVWGRQSMHPLSESSVYIRPAGTGMSWQKLASTHDSGHTISIPLSPGSTYYISVTAGWYPPDAGEQVAVTVQGKQYEPDTVYNIAAEVAGSGIVVSWDEVDDEDLAEYVVVAGASFELGDVVGRVPRSPLKIDFPISPGTYQYWVVARDRSGNDSASPESASVTVTGPSAPDLSYNIAGEVIQVKWPDPAGTYPIDYYTVNDDVVKDRVYTDRVNWTGIRTYTVTATDVAGNTGDSASIDVDVDEPSAPIGLTTAGHPYEIRLFVNYTKDETFESLEIWQATENSREDVSFEKVADTGAATHTISGVPIGEVRYFWARTRDIYGNHSDFYPAAGGVSGAASSDPSDYLDLMQDSISEDELVSGLRGRIDIIDQDFVYGGDVYDDMYDGLKGAYSGLFDISGGHRKNLDDLFEVTNNHLSMIQGMESEIAGLITVEWDPDSGWDEGRFVRHDGTVWRCLVTHSAPSPEPGTDPEVWEETESIGVLVSNLDIRVDEVEGELATKASQLALDQLDGRVEINETEITQNAEEIALKASQTDLDQFSGLIIPPFDSASTYDEWQYVRYEGTVYRATQDIDFTPSPLPTNTDYWEPVANVSWELSTARSEVSVASDSIGLISETITGPITYDPESVYDDGVYVVDVDDIEDLDYRLSRAQIEVDGANSRINLLTEDIDTVEGRMAVAEMMIESNTDANGANSAAITALESGLESEGNTRATALSSLTTRVIETEDGIVSISQDITALESAMEVDGEIKPIASAMSDMMTYADEDSAVATWKNQVEAEHGSGLASITENATAISTLDGEVKAEYSLWLNANGHVTGFRNMITGAGQSEFDIVSDRFRVVNQNDAGDLKPVFTVGEINGQSAVGIHGDLIVDGSILGRHFIADMVVANTIRDSGSNLVIDFDDAKITVGNEDGLLVRSPGGVNVDDGGSLVVGEFGSLELDRGSPLKMYGYANAYMKISAAWQNNWLAITPVGYGASTTSFRVGWDGDFFDIISFSPSIRFDNYGNFKQHGWSIFDDDVEINGELDVDGEAYLRGTTRIDHPTLRSDGGNYQIMFSGDTLRPRYAAMDDIRLGASSYRYATVYADNFDSASDESLKTDISECTLGLDFINRLPAKKGKWKKGDDQAHYWLLAQDVEREMDRLGMGHAGGLYSKTRQFEVGYDDEEAVFDNADADGDGPRIRKVNVRRWEFVEQQDLDRLLNDGKDVTVFDEKDIYGIRYNEFIPIIIKAIQEISKQLKG